MTSRELEEQNATLTKALQLALAYLEAEGKPAAGHAKAVRAALKAVTK